ncbi:hypothetical protein BBO99_00001361 [Phytophthora kernoviae]|uniref:Uncharacterized protein n=2 Tax=Phytophthora kernoviae TaxID=325452 RepID=A0A3R7IGE2_9STRA|nr:hypothetical protein G195_002348 [Phytophthora kernoviae 00238/432]KAG2522844.1 hypothetical protein JM16_005602 [Phytophthora kernoviae]KAG2530777.1 hypothetical protein JM18_001194 [Phytophthora kernoviae]RLN10279.1 hypothetical protein BBI17_001149 [Phytophthora kernoviae]RLN84379.1 hypothetical protein BBO99_00001361 [Phytophthora kernoviae]
MTKQIMEDGRETKRVKLVHNTDINTTSAPMQRRLRKMSEEFHPSSFSFLVQARLLCVGMSVVYRVSLSLTIISTCTPGAPSSDSGSGQTTQSWVIAMSQTKFQVFYTQVNEILHHPAVIHHLTPAINQQQEGQAIDVEWKPFDVFLQVLTEIFRRYKYLKPAAFSIQADATTMNTGTEGLQSFLTDCWRALEMIMPALVVEPYLLAPLGREVLCIYLLMRDFLSLPENVLDANCTYANAILSLQDVEDLLPTHSEHACSICLELLPSKFVKGPDDQDDNNSRSSSGNTDVNSSTSAFSVKLPMPRCRWNYPVTMHSVKDSDIALKRMFRINQLPFSDSTQAQSMAAELPSPLYSGFFPQMVLTVDELMHYRRFGKERVAQLVRIIDDADCVYRWMDMRARSGRVVQKAQFLDIRPVSKQPASQQPSTLLKSSIHIVDVQPEEILQAIAKVKTRDARRTMSYLHGDEFVDAQTLLTFPTSADHKKPSYSYRAIKWCLLKANRREGQKSLDYCYLEYAGKRKAHAGASSVVGFCVQESIARDREVPTLERYDILRGQFIRTGILITKTHQSNILKVTAIAQIDGSMVPTAVRLTMEEIMVDFVASVHRVKGLLERQRMGRLQYLDEWDWVSSHERKACAVCLRGFYFHPKSKKEALDKLVEHVRQIRDTINVAISEAEEEEERHSTLLESGRGDPDAGAERYDVIYDRIMKIRDTLDMSSSDFDAVLESIGHNDPVRPSETSTGRLDTDLAFSYSEGTASDHPSGLESDSAEFLSSRSSFASGSVQLLDHQDAGEPLPSPTLREHSASDEARALEEAMRWVHQSEPTVHVSSARPASPAAVDVEEPVSLDRRPLDADATETTTTDNVPDESTRGLSPSNEESGQVRTAAATMVMPPPAAPGTIRRARARDESGELRELMEGLAKAPLRSRCSSGQSTGAPPTEKFDF